MALEMDWGPGKRFSRPPVSVAREVIGTRTVNDGTNDLVNLARLKGVGAGETGRQGRQSIGAERLESAGDGGRPGKSSPPEGPGETAVGKTSQRRGLDKKWKKDGIGRSVIWGIPLEHDEGVEERGGRGQGFWMGGGKEGRRRKKRLVDSLHGNWADLAFPGRFCRWSRDEPTGVFVNNVQLLINDFDFPDLFPMTFYPLCPY